MTPEREKQKWRKRFEEEGREAVRQKLYMGGYGLDREREVAKEWLRDKEIEQEKRDRKLFGYAKWTWDAAFAAAVLAAIAIVVALIALPPDRIKALQSVCSRGDQSG